MEHVQGKAKVTSNEQVKVKSEKASEQVDSNTLYVSGKVKQAPKLMMQAGKKPKQNAPT